MKFDEEYVQVSPVITVAVFAFDDWSNDTVQPFAAANVSRQCCRPVATGRYKVRQACLLSPSTGTFHDDKW